MRAARVLTPPVAPLVLIVGVSGLLGSFGCSSRVETAAVAADSTLVYSSRKPGGVEAAITLYKSVSKKTGKPVGEGSVFVMGEKAKVRALVELQNPHALGRRSSRFHVLWLGPGGDEIFRKRIDYVPSDSSAVLESSLSIPPGRREPGAYACQVYLFQELIAEKRFELRLGEEKPSGPVEAKKKRSDV